MKKDNIYTRCTKSGDTGSIMVVVMFMLVILTILGISASTISTADLQIAENRRQEITDFYAAEGGLNLATATINTWLDEPFLLAGETKAYKTFGVDMDNDGRDDAHVEVRCIEPSGTVIKGLSSTANDLPKRDHVSPPPIGSGYSARLFEVRRYGITSGTKEGNAKVQAGVWKVFQRFDGEG